MTVKFSVISMISGVSGNSGESTWPLIYADYCYFFSSGRMYIYIVCPFMDEVLSEKIVKKNNKWNGLEYSKWKFCGWKFSGWEYFRWEFSKVGDFSGGSLIGGNFLVGNFPGGNFLRTIIKSTDVWKIWLLKNMDLVAVANRHILTARYVIF